MTQILRESPRRPQAVVATRRVAIVTVLSRVLLASALAGARAEAAPLDPRGEDWEGLSQLVRLAEAEIGPHRVVVCDKLDLEELKPNDAIVFVHPERDLAVEELSVFMHAGGRVVLLDDFGSGEKLLAHFRIRRVPLPAHPVESLRHNAAFAIAEPASDHDAVRDVERVVTNHATGLADTGLNPLLVVRGKDEPDVLLAVAGIVGHGRFLAVGDASIAMNAMLRFPGNHALARAIVRYATEQPASAEEPAGGPDGKLYLLANDGVVTGQFAGTEPGPLRDIRRGFAEALAWLRHGMPPLAAYFAALLVGVGVALWASRRAGRTHKPSAPRFVRPVPLADQGGVAGHVAILGASGASIASAGAELRSAVEEQIAARLGLDAPAPHETLAVAVHAAGLLGPTDAARLARLLAELGRFEPLSAKAAGAPRLLGSVRQAELVAMADRARELLLAMDVARHGTIGRPT